MPDRSALPASQLHALCVYAEPLVAGRRVVVLGDGTRRLGERLLELGARVVHVYDPQPARAASLADEAPRGLTVLPLPAGDFDVRDGAFDLAVVADISELPAPAALLARLRRILAPGGAVLVRSRCVDAAERGRSRAGAGQGTLDYYELFDLVAMQFAHVRMIGQLPWTGVALAELGREGEPDVTVDTQLVTEAGAPEAFIALGSQGDVQLAEYALVQVPPEPAADTATTLVSGSNRADLAAAQLRASLLEAQVEELRAQRNQEAVAHGDALSSAEALLAERLAQLQDAEESAIEASARAEQALAEVRRRDEELARLRDRAALGARELDEERHVRARLDQELVAARRSLETAGRDSSSLSATALRVPMLEVAVAQLEAGAAEQAQRLSQSEAARARLESALARALVELEEARRSQEEGEGEDEESEDESALEAEAAARLEELQSEVSALEAEAAALHDGHGQELVALEEALRDRGRVTYALEHELARRERIILDLVHALDEARTEGAEGGPTAGATETAPRDTAVAAAEASAREARARADRLRTENAELRQKLDAAALEVARREAEMTTSAWRVQELEQTVARLEDEQSELTMTIPPPAFVNLEREANDATVLATRLAAIEDELDMVRQALAQEHAARLHAESGEALREARADLARQAALLETLSRELEAHDGVRRPTPTEGGADEPPRTSA